jgi:RND family efflux transporter MFP subunit
MRTPWLALSGLLLLSPAAAQNNDNTAGAPVITASATLEPDRVVLELLGSAQARASVSLYPEVEGEVAEVLFQAGQRVRAGQILVRLDDTQQRLAVQLAEAQWRVAQVVAQRLQATRGTGAVPDTEIDQAVAEARTREITLAQAREDLADRVLRAPFAGVVGIPAVERGDRVSRTTLVSTLDDRREILVDIDLPEAWLARVRVGQALQASTPAFAGQTFEGQVRDIDSRVDPLVRTVRVRAALDNADDRLRAGMSFQVRLVFEGEPLVSVPELALQFGYDGGYVWTVRDGKAEAVAAQVVRREDGRVRLRSALREGDTVVVEGVQRLRDGRAVRVVGQRNGDAR